MNYISASILSAGLIAAFALSSWIDSGNRTNTAATYDYSKDMFVQAIGEASMRVAANSVEWRLNIRKTGKTAKESFTKLEAARNDLTEHLFANGLNERDLSYEPVQLQEDISPEKYSATQQIRVFTDDIAAVEKIINNSAAASENVLNIMGLSSREDSLIYRYSMRNSGYDELYAAATANAAKNAQAIAKLYGKEIGIARNTNIQSTEFEDGRTGVKTKIISVRSYVDYALR